MRSASEERIQALVPLLIFTLYHRGDTGSSGVSTESTISTVVPSWIVMILSPLLPVARGEEESCVDGDITTAKLSSVALSAASNATVMRYAHTNISTIPPKNPVLRRVTFRENMYSATAPQSRANDTKAIQAHALAVADDTTLR